MASIKHVAVSVLSILAIVFYSFLTEARILNFEPVYHHRISGLENGKADAFALTHLMDDHKTRHSRDTDLRFNGRPCSGFCEKRGSSYYWCYTPSTEWASVFWREWDYCTPSPKVSIQGTTTCGINRKCDQIIRYGSNVAWCCDKQLDCVKCLPTN